MCKKWKCLLFMLVATIMVCSMSIGVKVYAEEGCKNETYAVKGEDGAACYTLGADIEGSSSVLEAEVNNNAVSTLSLEDGDDGSISFTTFEDLKELAGRTYTDYTDANYVSEDPLVITEDVTLPEYLYISANGQQLVVAEGVTLTLEKRSYVNATYLKIEGTLIGNAGIYISDKLTIAGVLENNNHIGLGNSAVMCVEEGGSYTGSGYIYLYGTNESADFTEIVSGLNLDDFEATYEYGYWRLRDVSGLIKLGTPADLKWGRDFAWEWNEETQSSERVEIERPGSISWQSGDPDQGEVKITVYKNGETEPYDSYWWSLGTTEPNIMHSVDSFAVNDPESGTYYFTVTSRGDYTQYRDSETVVSDTWTYTKPSVQLKACTNLSWDWPQVNWEKPTAGEIGGYYVEFLYAENENETPEVCGATWSNDTSGTSDSVYDNIIQHNGNGYYYFRVRALSRDITKICNGEWSELSKPYILTDLSQAVEEELGTIIASAATADEIKDAVQNMDTEELKSAMLADTSNAGTVDKISELESAVGGAAAVDVADDVSTFDASKVSIVGANLNNAASADEPIALVIDKPENEDVIPEAYDNALAIRFSMTLDNVEDPENLKVPVKITLPVPSTINPEFLVILHYHAATGEVEELRPYVYSEGGQYYASFVLTSFSDFVMTQTVQKIEFEDVEAGSYYEVPVQWAVEKGITNGYGSSTIFCPEVICTRVRL